MDSIIQIAQKTFYTGVSVDQLQKIIRLTNNTERIAHATCYTVDERSSWAPYFHV